MGNSNLSKLKLKKSWGVYYGPGCPANHATLHPNSIHMAGSGSSECSYNSGNLVYFVHSFQCGTWITNSLARCAVLYVGPNYNSMEKIEVDRIIVFKIKSLQSTPFQEMSVILYQFFWENSKANCNRYHFLSSHRCSLVFGWEA